MASSFRGHDRLRAGPRQSWVGSFKPSTHGLHFENSFAQAPVITVDLPGFGERGFGDASGGLCGGMVFAVRDLFDAGILPPADTTPPLPETALFNYLCDRLMASFDLPGGAFKYYEWMTAPDADSIFRRSPISRTIHEEWPAIQAELDAGLLAPLGLVTIRSFNPADLAQCHQVLAYGYDLDDTSILRLSVYDPNLPDRDDLALTLNLNELTAPSYRPGMEVRGFFLTPYDPADPSDVFE